MDRLTGATEEQTEAEAEAARQTQELQAVIEDTAERVAALADAYTEAYAAAMDSISGQYDLWDEAAKVVEISAGSINNALESQITYWQDYNANLESLRERTGDVEGLSDVIASFADGSQDSVNAIAGLANASDEDLRAMVTNWQALQKEQEAAAGSVADLKTDFTSTMDELQAELAEDIDAMDLGDEAAAAGKATLQGYIDGANAMLPQVQAAYAELASAAVNALGNSHAAAYNTARAKQAISTRRGYASGTNNAEPGWAMVGENGPELMFFNGGEQVLNAAETSAMQPKISSDIQMMTMAAQMMAMLNAHSGQGVGAISAELGGRGAPTNISVSVPIQVTGNAGPDTLEALRELRSSCQKKDGQKSSGPSFAPSCRI